MKKIVLFTAILAFVAGSAIAVSSFYQSDVEALNDETAISQSIDGDGDNAKKDSKKSSEKKNDTAKSKDCSSKSKCCKKGSKSNKSDKSESSEKSEDKSGDK